MHQLQQPWRWQADGDYFFCNTQGCAVVYFSTTQQIKQSALRQKVGVKSDADDGLLCYCFHVSRADACDERVRSFVVAQTGAGQCACHVRNPSGRCCLKDWE